MALRLTGSTLTSEATPAAAPLVPNAAGLVWEAQAKLAAGDIDGYKGLFRTAEQHHDSQRRYEARLALLQQGVTTASKTTSDKLSARTFLAVAEEALAALEADPAEPVLLNVAGVACYELWSLDSAHSLFKAAQRLDPALPNVERNLAEVHRRKRAGARTRRPLHAAVQGLARKASRVAGRARPAGGLTISLCMIVKDEEQMLPRCLAAARDAVDEIIVVDTGSTDSTVEIARSFGANVIEIPWTGSFSDARNASFEAATSDWLLYLDADEVLVSDDVPELRALTGQTWREAFYLIETSYTGELGDGSAMTNNALRVFRDRPEYRFSGRIHEQISPTLPTYAAGRLAQCSVRVEHFGYLGSVREAKEKSTRNIALLRQQAAEGTPDAFLHFNLGSEYAAVGDQRAAITELERARSMLRQDGIERTSVFAPPLMLRLVQALRACGRGHDAIAVADQGLELFPAFTDLVLEQATEALQRGDEAEATRLYERCLEMGDAAATLGGAVGAGTLLPRLALATMHLGADEVEPALSLLQWCVEHHPTVERVANLYARALLRDGVEPPRVIAEIEERLPAVSPSVRAALAGALHAAGSPAGAADQYRLALAADPGNDGARVALAEILLAAGEYSESSNVSAAVSPESPHAALAMRIELCGLLASGQIEPAREALVRSARVAVPAVEREVFTAWLEIVGGAPAPQGLPAAGVPMLAVIMQTLLGAGDQAAFEALVPALEGSRLERREQRELLAEMYLGHGQVSRAASEWMAVCSETPDVRALVGLARIAAGQGMAEDAITFAGGALKLDPNCAAAEALVAGLGGASAQREAA